MQHACMCVNPYVHNMSKCVCYLCLSVVACHCLENSKLWCTPQHPIPAMTLFYGPPLFHSKTNATLHAIFSEPLFLLAFLFNDSFLSVFQFVSCLPHPPGVNSCFLPVVVVLQAKNASLLCILQLLLYSGQKYIGPIWINIFRVFIHMICVDF